MQINRKLRNFFISYEDNAIKEVFDHFIKNTSDNYLIALHKPPYKHLSFKERVNLNTFFDSLLGPRETLDNNQYANALLLYKDDVLIGASLSSSATLISLAVENPFNGIGSLLYQLTLILNGSLNYEAAYYARGFYTKMGATNFTNNYFTHSLLTSNIIERLQRLERYFPVVHKKTITTGLNRSTAASIPTVFFATTQVETGNTDETDINPNIACQFQLDD